MITRPFFAVVVAVPLLFLAACSDANLADDAQADVFATTTTQTSTTQAPSPTSTAPSTETSTTASAAPLIEVEASDYEFSGIPATATVGTRLALFNNSAIEFHEMTVFRLDPTEMRPIRGVASTLPQRTYCIRRRVHPVCRSRNAREEAVHLR